VNVYYDNNVAVADLVNPIDITGPKKIVIPINEAANLRME